MKRFATLAAVVLLGSCAPTALLQQRPGPPALACDVEITFASSCCGIDQPAHAHLSRVIHRAKGVGQALEWTWGREGECSICLVTASKADAQRLFTRLTATRYPAQTSVTTVKMGERAVVLEATVAKH